MQCDSVAEHSKMYKKAGESTDISSVPHTNQSTISLTNMSHSSANQTQESFDAPRGLQSEFDAVAAESAPRGLQSADEPVASEEGMPV